MAERAACKEAAFVGAADHRATARRVATREALGATLAELAGEGLPVVAVDADLAGSTTMQRFADASPTNKERLFNCGIAEQNMIGVAAGLSLAGHVAFTGSFAVFGTGRVYDQIRNTVAYSRLNVKIVPTHAGISVGADGGSHQMLEDVSLMRGLPYMTVLVPADYAAACSALRTVAHLPGPAYVRLGRAALPCLYNEGVDLEVGRSYLLSEGSDATVIACGVEVNEALVARDLLAAEGIQIEVIDAFSLKPFDADTLIASVRKTGCVVVAEEHSVYGGLCSIVAETLTATASVPVEFVAVRDTFGKSGSFEELLAYFNLDAAAIVEAVKKAVGLKRI
ncbi:MAG: transketolase family protein [Eggerthellaceae bacterium]|jgi:transketolase|nr:transketolase family protein [Eggerthellaceae bacterium]MDR2715893.1 transketolase family protein [Coriobacteriaceae bacterium]